MSETTAKAYGFRITLGLSHQQALRAVTEALKEEGFGVLTEIDVEATLKKKLNAEFRPYTILGACNPVLAREALGRELEIGLLLPCNVIVYEQQGRSVVSIVDPAGMLELAGNPALAPVAAEAQSRLRRVARTLGWPGESAGEWKGKADAR